MLAIERTKAGTALQSVVEIFMQLVVLQRDILDTAAADGDALEEAVPGLEDAVPVLDEADPVLEEAVPDLEEAVPVFEEAVPVLEEADPVLEEAVPVFEEAVPVLEEAVLVLEEAVPVPGPVRQQCAGYPRFESTCVHLAQPGSMHCPVHAKLAGSADN